jgi:outer membrane protein assembly factor BamB
MEVPPELSLLWSQQLGERATAPVVAGGRLISAVVSRGEVRALDATTGRPLWRFLAPARVDSPPTIHGALCLFGCHDGSVWCLRLDDGQLVWRRDCAPEEKRIVAYDRLESPWPVLGSVLVHDDVLYALAGRLTRVDGGMHLWALEPETGREVWRQHLLGIYGEKAGVLPHSWYIDEEHMVNNLLLAKDQRLRIYDQYGGWQFSTKDGRFEGQSSDVLQPGWPKGRRTPKNEIVDERWPWCGWDRVTSSEVLAGQDTFNVYAVGMSPDRRGVGGPGQQWLFPRAGGWGIHSREILKEEHFVLRPKRFGEPDLPDDKLPWKPRKLSLDIEAYVFTDGGDKLLIAGGLPFSAHPERGRILVISMKDGRDLASLELDAVPVFDGVAAASGRIYVSTVDGRIVCVGADRG